MKSIRLFLLLIPALALSGSLHAQIPAGPPNGMRAAAIGRVYGKLLDAATKEPVGYATVAAYRTLPGGKDTLISGGLTRENGDFNLTGLPGGPLKITLSFMGYEPLEKKVMITPQNNEQDLGNLTLAVSAQMLKEVTVTAEQSTIQLRADRKVFNVEKNLASAGGTAEDVLKSVPSVNVDADGNASLRNQGAQILIDGRPTLLSLNQIPAGDIEQVEVITNPGAKYDANTTGGILNIVLKKNRKPGYNGMVSGGIGTTGRYNGMVNLSAKQDPWNISFNYNVNATTNNTVNGYLYRTDLTDNQPSRYFNQDNRTDFKHLFQMGRLSVDYTLDNRNTLSVAGSLMGGNHRPDELQQFTELDGQQNRVSSGIRHNETDGQWRNYTAQGTWRRTFPEKGKELVLDGQYTIGRSKNLSQFDTRYFLSDGSEQPNPELQNNDGGGRNNQTILQLDYTDPLGENAKLELGARSFRKTTLNWLDVTHFDYNDYAFIADSFLTTDYDITEMINAAYANFTGASGPWGYVAGLRFEASNFKGRQATSEQEFSYNYPGKGGDVWKAFFPSLYLTRKLSEKQELQINASRKINRPNWHQIMPFFMFADKYNYRIGNPALKPEFVNLGEINYSLLFGQNNLLASLYVRHTEDPITSILYRSPDDPNVLVGSFENGSNSIAFGMDNTLKLQLGKAAEWTNNVNVFQTKITAQNFENSGWAYNLKSTLSLRLPAAFSVQAMANYESPRILPQGKTVPMFFSDLSVKKDFGKSFSLTVAVVDVFNTRRMGQELVTANYLQEFSRRRETRFIRATAMYRFGKPDASLFKKKPQQRNGGGQDEGGFGF